MNKKRNGVKSPKMVLFILYKFQSSTDTKRSLKVITQDIINPRPTSDRNNISVRHMGNNIEEIGDNIGNGVKENIFEAASADNAPNDFDRVQLRGARWQISNANIIWNKEPFIGFENGAWCIGLTAALTVLLLGHVPASVVKHQKYDKIGVFLG